MDKQMAPTSQMFSHGGILIRDWFSDRLQQKHGSYVTVWHQQETLKTTKQPGTAQGSQAGNSPGHDSDAATSNWPGSQLSKAVSISLGSVLEIISSVVSWPSLFFSLWPQNPLHGRERLPCPHFPKRAESTRAPSAPTFAGVHWKTDRGSKTFTFLMLALDSICL